MFISKMFYPLTLLRKVVLRVEATQRTAQRDWEVVYPEVKTSEVVEEVTSEEEWGPMAEARIMVVVMKDWMCQGGTKLQRERKEKARLSSERTEMEIKDQGERIRPLRMLWSLEIFTITWESLPWPRKSLTKGSLRRFICMLSMNFLWKLSLPQSTYFRSMAMLL